MIFYHVTRLENEDSIMRLGLIPQIGVLSETSGEPVPAIYLFKSLDDVHNALCNWMEDECEDDVVLMILEIKLPDDFPIYPTFEDDEGSWEWHTYSTIPPEYITVIDRNQ